MKLPQEFINSLEGLPGFDRQAFLDVHENPAAPVSIRLNPLKLAGPNKLIFADQVAGRVPWCENAYYLQLRPSFTFDPLFHAGCYYVQEASSMFLEQVLKQHADLSKDLVVLDLSAAPGGKSTHLQSLLSPGSLILCNEVIRSRARILEENMIRWGGANRVVTQNDPRDFTKFEGFFDIIVVDAPCSGSGLFRRDPSAIDEWSAGNVQICSGRQQRILADVLPALKENGLLVYSTCSYSREEDEEIAGWLEKTFGLTELATEVPAGQKVIRSEKGYRFWPDKIPGEGFYLAAFRHEGRHENTTVKRSNANRGVLRLPAAEKEIISKWMHTNSMNYFKGGKNLYAWPEEHAGNMGWLASNLSVIYSGVRMGEIMREKLVPAHALALSGFLNEKIPRVELENSQAIDYLSRKELLIEGLERGWHVVCFRGHELGWINALGNRLNNYYPMEMRILKERP